MGRWSTGMRKATWAGRSISILLGQFQFVAPRQAGQYSSISDDAACPLCCTCANHVKCYATNATDAEAPCLKLSYPIDSFCDLCFSTFKIQVFQAPAMLLMQQLPQHLLGPWQVPSSRVAGGQLGAFFAKARRMPANGAP